MSRSVEVASGATSCGWWVLYDCEVEAGVSERFEFASQSGQVSAGATSVPLADDEAVRVSTAGGLGADFVTVRCASDVDELTVAYADGTTCKLQTSPVSPVSGDRFAVIGLEAGQALNVLQTEGGSGPIAYRIPQRRPRHSPIQ